MKPWEASRVAPKAGALQPSSVSHAARIAFATFVGTALEWYDYFLFGTAASLVFNRLFFSSLDARSATLAAFATFGVGFVARPVGAVLFGWAGDRVGRKPALLVAVILIGVATGLVGLLPDYMSIGVAAPVLLVLLRLAQGVAVGGEWGGAVTLAVEHAPEGLQGRYAAMPQLGSPVGTLMSSGAFSLALLLPAQAFDSWGWRLPFLAAFPLLAVAVYIRRRVDESPGFERLAVSKSRATVPAMEVLRYAPGRLFIGVAAMVLGIGGFYLMTTFVISYGVTNLGLSRELMINATVAASFVEIVVIALAGSLSDRVGAGSVTCGGGLICAALSMPVFLLLRTGQPAFVVLALTLGIAMASITYGAAGALLTSLFPVRLRYSGVALSYNIAGALTGFVPFAASAMLAAGDNSVTAPALLLAGMALTTAAAGAVAGRIAAADQQGRAGVGP